jgi:hypothetical protein
MMTLPTAYRAEFRNVSCYRWARRAPLGAFPSYPCEVAPKTQLPRPDASTTSLVRGAEAGNKESVHNVHTLGFGSGRTGAGLDRIADVIGGVAGSQGVEPGSSPTSGTAFPLVRGVFALTCRPSLWWRPSVARFAGSGLATAVACSGVWVAGSVPWLVGAPPAVSGILRLLVPDLSSRPGVAHTYSWPGGAEAT